MDINGIVGLVGTVVGIVIGVVTGYWFWLLNYSAKKMSSRTSNLVLLDPQKPSLPSKLEFIFNGKRINSLNRADCIIWNSGRPVILHSDVRPPGIIISLPTGGDCEILDITSEVSSPNNELLVQQESDKIVSCRFQYLRRQEGFRLSILYVGPATVPEVKAVIPDSRSGGITGPERSKKINKYATVFAFSLTVFFLGALSLSHFLRLNEGISAVVIFIALFLLMLLGQIVFQELEISPPSFSAKSDAGEATSRAA